MKDYESFVFQPHEFNHSGVLSPALNLNPKYRLGYIKRRDALTSLRQWLKHYVTARKAVFWCAVNDQDVLIRHQARNMLREEFFAENCEEVQMVYPELADA